MTASNTSANALLQTTTPARLRGQTASLYMLAMRGGLSVGGLFTGAVVDWLGVRRALLLDGLLAIVLHAMLGRQWLLAPAPPQTR